MVRKWIVWLTAGFLVVVLVVVALALRPKAAPRVVTAQVQRKTLVATVTATGTVNPQDTILVGSQVSGTIQAIFADYNDFVHRGQVLARLDPTLFQEALDQARGTVAQAQGQVQVALAGESTAEADVSKARAALSLAQLTLSRDRALLRSGYVSRSQYDADYASYVTAQSSLGTAQAEVAQSRATLEAQYDVVDADEAQLRQAQTNLDHTVIVSPADGTVIQRNVSVGQTVAAALAAPTLFTLGKDLARMEIDLNVGEPDVGNVRVGEAVTFTVLAYPNDVFRGRVAQVRQNPTTVQNVVTYDTVVYENNGDGRLRPGMTPTASIEVARAVDALVVPVAALGFGTASQQRQATAPRASTSPWGDTGTAESSTFVSGSIAAVVVTNGGRSVTVPVRVMLVSGGQAAVEPLHGGTLEAGDEIAVSTVSDGTQTPVRAPGMFR